MNGITTVLWMKRSMWLLTVLECSEAFFSKKTIANEKLTLIEGDETISDDKKTAKVSIIFFPNVLKKCRDS